MTYDWKSALMVIDEQSSTWNSGVDALLFNPRNDHAPYIVARGYDAETGGWSSGSYYSDLMDAVVSLRGCIHPDNAISGCSVHDVRELYGQDYGTTPEDERIIAREVNDTLSKDDELFSDELYKAVIRRCGESHEFSRACGEASTALEGMGQRCESAGSYELAEVAAENALRYRSDPDAKAEIMAMVSGEGRSVSEIAAAVMNYAIIHATVSIDDKPDPTMLAASAGAAAKLSADQHCAASSRRHGV